MGKFEDYIPIVGQAIIDDLRLAAEKLKGKTIQIVNSTAVGGGVAEILNRMVPLLKELGINTRWDVIKGGTDFSRLPKNFITPCTEKQEEITQHDFDIFMETSRQNIEQA